MDSEDNTIEGRFWPKVDKHGPDECWLWTGATAPSGYGQLRSQLLPAHRVSYVLANGPIVPDGTYHGPCVCHRCDVRLCVNPAHLFLASHGDNMRDMISKGRARGTAQAGVLHAKARLTEDEVRQIRASPASVPMLAALFHVSPGAIRGVRSGTTWRHLID